MAVPFGVGAVRPRLCAKNPHVIEVRRRRQRLRARALRFGRTLTCVAAILSLRLRKTVAPAVCLVGTTQHNLGHLELGVECRRSHSPEIQRYPVREGVVPWGRNHRHARTLEALGDCVVPLNLFRITVDVLVHDDRCLVHQGDQVFPFLITELPFLFPLVVPVTAKYLVDGPKAQLRCFRHEDVLVAMKQCSDLKLCEQSRPAVIDDDVRHALEKFQNGQVLLLTEIYAGTFVGRVATDHRHPLQPCDRIAKIGVDLDTALIAGLIEAPDGQRPLGLRQCLHRRPPEPYISMRHIIIAVGQYHAVGRSRCSVDGRKRYRHVRLTGTAEAGTYRYHARLERRLTDSGYYLAPPLGYRLTLRSLALTWRDDDPVL